MEKTRFRLRVNGEERELLAPVHHTLLEVLREELGLTGTKHGCELGSAAPARWVDGGGLSCLAMPIECEAARSRPWRAWPGRRPPSPPAGLRRAGAAQCGYESPAPARGGGLVRENPAHATQIAEALAGNLCRCTGIEDLRGGGAGCARMRGEGPVAGGPPSVDDPGRPQIDVVGKPCQGGRGGQGRGPRPCSRRRGPAEQLFARIMRSRTRTRAWLSRRVPASAHPGVGQLVPASCPYPSASCPCARTSTRWPWTRSASWAKRARWPLSTRTRRRRLWLIDADYEVLPR